MTYAHPGGATLVSYDSDSETYVGTCYASSADSDDPNGDALELAIAYDGWSVDAYLDGEPVQLTDDARGELARMCRIAAERFDANEADAERCDRGVVAAMFGRAS